MRAGATAGSGDRSARRVRRDSFVVRGLPHDRPLRDLIPTLAHSNAQRLGMSEHCLRDGLRDTERLHRKLNHGPEAGQWVPSASVRFSGDPTVVKRILDNGVVLIDFRAFAVSEYSVPVGRCFHCGTVGHSAKYCRGRCCHCGASHPTVPCPLIPRRSGQTDSTSQSDNQFPRSQGILVKGRQQEAGKVGMQGSKRPGFPGQTVK